jgi:hypothetical protein
MSKSNLPDDVLEIDRVLKKHQDFILKNYIVYSNGDWKTKGFINSNGIVFPIPSDTKVISKILEMDVIAALESLFKKKGYRVEFPSAQNTYPDITLHTPISKSKVAIDVKTTYKPAPDKINGFTLGAFTGYFRNKTSKKNTLYPYGSYIEHRVYGVVYERKVPAFPKLSYTIAELDSIPSVAGNFTLINQPKYAIASGSPGSGNTKNIGAIKDIKSLVEGLGPFVLLAPTLGLTPAECFELYWRNYMTNDMLKGSPAVFTNLKQFTEAYKNGVIKSL